KLKHIEELLVQNPLDSALEEERWALRNMITRAPFAIYDERPIDRLRTAVDRYQRAQAAGRAYPKDVGLQKELRMAEDAIYREQPLVNDDNEQPVLAEDGKFVTDLGDDRIVGLRVLIPLKLKKNQRAAA